jgi:hypothetical protein
MLRSQLANTCTFNKLRATDALYRTVGSCKFKKLPTKLTGTVYLLVLYIITRDGIINN